MAALTYPYEGTAMVHWLEHCGANIQIVGSNPTYTWVCRMFPLGVSGVTSTKAK